MCEMIEKRIRAYSDGVAKLMAQKEKQSGGAASAGSSSKIKRGPGVGGGCLL